VRRAIVGAGVLVAVGIVAAGTYLVMLRERSFAQPIAFNHRKHIKEVGLACPDCHLHALDGTRATIPNLSVCSTCHAEPVGSSPEEARVVAMIQQGTPIPWRKVNVIPDHVYFSHRRHTTLGKIECPVCHGEMAERVLPLRRSLVKVSMKGCVGCHDKAKVTSDCIACHR